LEKAKQGEEGRIGVEFEGGGKVVGEVASKGVLKR